MARYNEEDRHLQGVTFQISYPSGPFYPSGLVTAKFSGVLTAEGQIHVKLDGGSIPGHPSAAGVPIRGSFSAAPGEAPLRFTGTLSDNRIQATLQM
jgi:hypothetical protein